MIELFITLTFFLIFVIHHYLGKWKTKKKSFPAPFGLPVIGQLPFIIGCPEEKFLEWKKKYGPVFHMQIFGKDLIVLNDKRSITECFSKQEFSGRHGSALLKLLSVRAGPGFIFNEGPEVVELRQFLLKTWKDQGLQNGKPELESLIQSELSHFLQTLKATNGNFFLLLKFFPQLVLNCLWPAVAGFRLTAEDADKLLAGVLLATRFETVLEKFSLFAPSLIARFSNIVEEKAQTWSNLALWHRKSIEEHKQTRIPDQPRDLIDRLLDEVDKFRCKEENSSAFCSQPNVVESVLREIVAPAVDTLTATLSFVMVYSCHFRGPWKKAVAEIDQVLGTQPPIAADKGRLPYTMACIVETLRHCGLINLGVPHSAIVDSEFRGVTVKKGTILIANQYAIHSDPELWEDPQMFIPERFLQTDGTLVPNVWNRLMLFSAGKRSCPGVILSEDILFLTITSILQSFDIKTKEPLKFIEKTEGISSRPHERIEIAVTPRISNVI